MGNRRVTLCRELTKKHEEAHRVTLDELVSRFEAEDPLGECVLVIEGRPYREIIKEKEQEWLELSVDEHMNYYIQQGINRKEAMKKVAKDRGVSKRDIYQHLIREE